MTGKLPKMYHRFVDDIMLIFKNEANEANVDSFLDILIRNTSDGSFVTSVYRKTIFFLAFHEVDQFCSKSIPA